MTGFFAVDSAALFSALTSRPELETSIPSVDNSSDREETAALGAGLLQGVELIHEKSGRRPKASRKLASGAFISSEAEILVSSAAAGVKFDKTSFVSELQPNNDSGLNRGSIGLGRSSA
jgi:hypothetical protein